MTALRDLEVVAGEHTYRFAPGETVRVGRHPSCDVVVDDPLVSREHAVVDVTGGAWHWHDRSSRGTWVDEVRRTEIPVLAPVTVQLGRLGGPALVLRPVVDAGPPPTPRGPSWLAALGGELTRQARSLAADRGRLALAVVPGPLLALVLVAAVRGGFRDPGQPPDPTFDPGGYAVWFDALPTARLAVVGLVVAAVASGVLAGCRMLGERRLGHAPPPSAVVVAALLLVTTIALLEALAVTAIAVPPQDGPAAALVFGRPVVEVGAMVFLAMLASASLGLAVSTLVRRPGRAVAAALLLLVASVLLSGAVVDLTSTRGLTPASWLTPGRWSTQALGSSVDLGRLDKACVAADLAPLPLPAGVERPGWPDTCPVTWEHTPQGLWNALLPLAMLIPFYAALAYLVVRRRQPPAALRAA